MDIEFKVIKEAASDPFLTLHPGNTITPGNQAASIATNVTNSEQLKEFTAHLLELILPCVIYVNNTDALKEKCCIKQEEISRDVSLLQLWKRLLSVDYNEMFQPVHLLLELVIRKSYFKALSWRNEHVLSKETCVLDLKGK